MKRGRPSIYTPELAAEICARMAKGESLRGICESEHMPGDATVRGWALDDVNGFSAQYARARELQAHALVDEIMEISDDGTNDWMARRSEAEKGAGVMTGWVVNGEHVNRSRLRVDSRKWFASKVLPKIYGEKVQVGGDPDAPIKHDVEIRPQLTREEWLKIYSGKSK